MVVGDHTFSCLEWYGFCVWELVEGFIKILQRDAEDELWLLVQTEDRQLILGPLQSFF